MRTQNNGPVTTKQAVTYLRILTGETDPVMDVRVIAESPKAKTKLDAWRAAPEGERDSMRFNYRDRFSKLAGPLTKRNEAGNAIFYLTARSDGQGRKHSNIQAVRCVPLDLDGAPLPNSWDIDPHAIIETSPGRFQVIWAIEETDDFDLHRNVVKRMALRYNGDPCVSDKTRVLRLPGFLHHKGKAFRSRLVSFMDPAEVAFNRYTLSDFDAILPPLPEVEHKTGDSDAGTITCQQAKAYFEAVPVEWFGKDHGDDSNEKYNAWLAVGMAMHAANPDAMDLWLDWCAGDDRYFDEHHQAEAESKWHGFDSSREGGVGVGTLIHCAKEAGADMKAVTKIFRTSAKEEFDDLGPAPDSKPDGSAFERPLDFGHEFEGTSDADFGLVESDMYPAESMSALEGLNEKYCAVFSGGKYRIMFEEQHKGEGRLSACSRQDFLARHENQKIERNTDDLSRGASPYITLGNAWQSWPGRKTADGVCFDTNVAPGEIVNGALNIWSGFAMEPKKGICKKFKAMIRDDLCGGDPKVFEYVLKWTAWKLQNPGLLPEVAIVFRGAKGTGKTTYGKTLKSYFGKHALIVKSKDQFAGRFNGHLENICFLYGDESFWGGDREADSSIKKLITDEDATYEHKGVPTYQGVNHVGLIFAGNEKWIVPASIDERRFCVSEVSDIHVCPDDAPGDHPNRLYWDAVHTELRNGGREAFLFEMLHMELGNWHPRVGIPHTKAMGEQKLHGIKEVVRWYYERLQAGYLSPEPDGEAPVLDDTPTAWAEGSLFVAPAKITKEYSDWLAHRNPHGVVTAKTVITELGKYGWDSGDHCRLGKGRDRYYSVPKLSEARKAFADKIGMNPFQG